MSEYIKLEDAIAIIEEKQKELCPVGRYGRGYVYGSDREKYDAWDEIIDALENIPSADVAPVRHAKWEVVVGSDGKEYMVCTRCRKQQDLTGVFSYCPNCGANMDGGADDES